MFKWFALLVVVAYANANPAERGVASKSSGTSCRCGWQNRGGKRIVGGSYYKQNEFPFIAVLTRVASPGSYAPFCGGSIITPNHVITAAHCTDDIIKEKASIAVVLGAHDLSKVSNDAVIIPVSSISQHRDYNSKTVANDISILNLSKSIAFNSIIGPVCMPQAGLDVSGKTVTILGWGAEAFQGSMTLRPKKLDTTVVTPAACADDWSDVSATRPTQLCTQSKRDTACQGDSGGPVVFRDPETKRYTLVGLVSFGPSCTDEKPTVHTRVEAYLSWIQKQIAATKPSSTCVKV